MYVCVCSCLCLRACMCMYIRVCVCVCGLCIRVYVCVRVRVFCACAYVPSACVRVCFFPPFFTFFPFLPFFFPFSCLVQLKRSLSVKICQCWKSDKHVAVQVMGAMRVHEANAHELNCVCTSVCVRMCVRACVCVCDRERGK